MILVCLMLNNNRIFHANITYKHAKIALKVLTELSCSNEFIRMSCKFYIKLSFYITTNQETDFIRKLGNYLSKFYCGCNKQN